MTYIESKKESNRLSNTRLITKQIKEKLLRDYKKSERRLLLLDYDGTLSKFSSLPELAVPSQQVKNLIKSLSESEENHVCIISGRKSSELDQWFGENNITLIAEHGCSFKLPNTTEWLQMGSLDVSWKDMVRGILEAQVNIYPGSFIEEKIYSLAWHYRNVQSELNEKLFIDLSRKLTALNIYNHFSAIHGNKVLEIKCSGINKGSASQKFISAHDSDFILAIGDDRTDEDMFMAIPVNQYSVKVGLDESAARYYLSHQTDVLDLLDELYRKDLEIDFENNK